MSPWVALVWLWLLSLVLTLLSGLLMAAMAMAAGLRPTVVRFHFGPKLVAFRLLGVRWSLGPLPGGVSISFGPEGQPEPELEDSPIFKLPMPRRLLVISSSALGLFLMACVFLSPARALPSFLSGFEQVINLPRAPERITAFLLLLKAEGFWTALGVLSAKFAAFNLLPLFPLAGYQLLRELARKVRRATAPRMGALPLFFLVPMLVLWVGWLYGVYAGLRGLPAQPPAAEALTSERAAP